MLSIHDREFEPSDRSAAGHWEGDLIVGPNHRSGIGTLVERQTRYTKLLHLPTQDSLTVHAALVRSLGQLPAGLRRSLTWDQGTEMARHLEVAADAGIRVYFCDAASPWQCGTNENTTACCASTSRSRPTCPCTAQPTSPESSPNSTGDPA